MRGYCRAATAGDLWRRRFTDAESAARIADDHRPYHAALAAALAATRARFGIAVLVDLHSMPPLGPEGARIVIGDRFGRSAGDRFVARAMAVAAATEPRTVLNAPYAGAHILDRHGKPADGIHAMQVEARIDLPGLGMATTAALVARLVAALADEALIDSRRLAAE